MESKSRYVRWWLPCNGRVMAPHQVGDTFNETTASHDDTRLPRNSSDAVVVQRNRERH